MKKYEQIWKGSESLEKSGKVGKRSKSMKRFGKSIKKQKNIQKRGNVDQYDNVWKNHSNVRKTCEKL